VIGLELDDKATAHMADMGIGRKPKTLKCLMSPSRGTNTETLKR
jgi:hypothetical protein